MGFGSVGCDDGERRHKTANKATIIEVAATPPAPMIIIVDCLCFSCFEVSVGGSSDKIVSSKSLSVDEHFVVHKFVYLYIGYQLTREKRIRIIVCELNQY